MRCWHDLSAWFETRSAIALTKLSIWGCIKGRFGEERPLGRVSNHAGRPHQRVSGLTVLASLLLLTAAPALAQDRTPAQRQMLTDLAYVLGQSHALRQACQGAMDQYWRGRMLKMVDAETPDPAFETRLHNAFNAGFSSAQAQYPTCGPDSRQAEAAAAAHGQALASTLAKPMADDQTVR